MQQDVAQHRGGRTPTRHPGCLEQTWQGSLLALGVRGSFLSVKLHQRHLLIRRAHLLAESCYTKLLPESVSCMVQGENCACDRSSCPGLQLAVCCSCCAEGAPRARGGLTAPPRGRPQARRGQCRAQGRAAGTHTRDGEI